MSRPAIALSCSTLREAGYYAAYERALEAAGAAVVRISVGPGWEPVGPAEGLAGMAGLLLPGGWDVDPAAYGARRDPRTGEIDAALDGAEIGLVRHAVDVGVPVTGICRGLQLVNVALGGALHQHVEGHPPLRPRDRIAHPIAVEEGSALAEIAGARELGVNSLHHQAVSRVAPGLRVTARSPDGVIEGLESPDRAVVAVQCHPEELTGAHGWARRFFATVVERAGAGRA